VTALVTALVLVAVPAARADSSLTLTRDDVPGLTPAGAGSKVARSALGGKLPRALKGAKGRGAAFSGSGGRSLRVAVYPTSRAATALKQARAKGFKPVKGLGDGAFARTSTTKRATTAFVVLRAGAAFAAVRFGLSGRKRTLAAGAARSYAASLAARLRRVLSRTDFQKTLDGIGDDGSITPALALRAFAIAYGPIPGVKRPTGRNLGVPEDGTVAIDLVERVWDQLTAAQRTAIDAKLGTSHAGSSRRARSAEVLTPSAVFQTLAEKYATIYRAKLPSVPSPTMKVFKSDTDYTTKDGAQVWADALTVNAAGGTNTGTPAYCRVRITPFGQTQVGKPFFDLIIAHEVFHCFQAKMMAPWRSRSAWLIEGSADWAATSVVATSAAVGAGPYKLYLDAAAGKALYARAYDGTGFWHHVDAINGVGSLWPKLPAIFSAPDDDSSFAAAGGLADNFAQTWASAMYRFTGAGAAWHQKRPYDISATALQTPTIDVNSSAPLSTALHQTLLYTVEKDGDRPLVEVSGSQGSLRAGYNKADFGVVGGTRSFCFGKCKCPPKTTGTIPPNTKFPASFLTLALTGAGVTGAGTVVYHSLDEYCKKKDDKKGPSGPAESNGDPHLTSLDGLHFDFQAAGEFLLARSRSGDLQIQARQEPYGKSSTVTVNTQIALRVGGRRVTVSPGAGSLDQPVVRVDGTVDSLPAGTSEPLGDGTLAREADGSGYVDVTWADGSTVVVRPVGQWGVAMVIQLAGSRAGDVRGLLGDFDDNPADDLADRKGRPIKYTAKATGAWGDGLTRFRVAEEFQPKFFDALYDDVGDAWRISQAESLFDYGPGQSTKTFTNKKIPTKPVDPEEVRRARRAEAERICREHGVTLPGPLEDCITDVAATGNAAFADDAYAAQQAASVLWTQLAGGTQMTSNMTTTTTADGVLRVAFDRRIGTDLTTNGVSIPIAPSGAEGPEEIVNPGDGDVGLYTAEDGTANAVTAEIPSAAPSGIYHYARGADGSWVRLGQVTSYGYSYADTPVALAVPGGGLLTISPMAGVSQLFSGATGAGQGVPVPVPPGCYGSSPAMARDSASGQVFVAWYQWDCPQVGVFVAQVDPATGTFVGTPVQAPGSSWTSSGGQPAGPDPDLGERLAMTGRPGQPGVFLAYPTGLAGNVALWRVGAPAATTLQRRKTVARHVRLAADGAGGRVWVVWREDDRLWIQRTAPDGATADGASRPAAVPKSPGGEGLRLYDTQIAARGGALDVLVGYHRSDTPGGLYRARIAP
jgi:von Willebrand factor type D domain